MVEYDRLLRCYVLDELGSLAVVAVTPAHLEQLLTALVRKESRQGDRKPVTPGTVKHVWDVTRRVPGDGGAVRRPTRLVSAARYENLLRHDPQAPTRGGRATGDPPLDGVCARDVRLHDLRHTFAVLQLSAGTHFMQVSKWLGHSTYTLMLDVYGDYIPEQDGGVANTLPEPPAPAMRDLDRHSAAGPSAPNAVDLFRTEVG